MDFAGVANNDTTIERNVAEPTVNWEADQEGEYS